MLRHGRGLRLAPKRPTQPPEKPDRGPTSYAYAYMFDYGFRVSSALQQKTDHLSYTQAAARFSNKIGCLSRAARFSKSRSSLARSALLAKVDHLSRAARFRSDSDIRA